MIVFIYLPIKIPIKILQINKKDYFDYFDLCDYSNLIIYK